MKVLVTGGNGLLGSHVVRALINGGYKVRVIVRRGSDLRALERLEIELIEGEIAKLNDIRKAVKGCDYVIHAAARTAQFPSGLDAYWKPNVESTKHLICACKEFFVKRFVLVSSANCFGNGTKENPGNEDTPFIPWLKNSGYAYSKFLAQLSVLEESRTKELDAVVVNPTFIIGINDYKPSSGQIMGHVLNKRVVFYPPGGKNFVDAEMAACGVVKAMEKGRSGECYLLAGENYSYQSFFRMVDSMDKYKRFFVPIPKWVLMLLGAIGDFLEKYFRMPVTLNKTNARMLCLGNYFLAEKATRDLGFNTVPMENSVEKTILWFKANNYFQ